MDFLKNNNCQHFSHFLPFINIPWAHVNCQNKCWPYIFGHFDVVWYKHKTDRQAKYTYIYCLLSTKTWKKKKNQPNGEEGGGGAGGIGNMFKFNKISLNWKNIYCNYLHLNLFILKCTNDILHTFKASVHLF